MDRIIAQGMVFYGCHGVFPQEKLVAQPFKVDVILYVDLKPAGKNDDLELTVNYAEVYDLVKQQVGGRSYNLLEALAENIAADLLRNASVIKVKVRISKSEVMLEGIFDFFAVEIERGRN